MIQIVPHTGTTTEQPKDNGRIIAQPQTIPKAQSTSSVQKALLSPSTEIRPPATPTKNETSTTPTTSIAPIVFLGITAVAAIFAFIFFGPALLLVGFSVLPAGIFLKNTIKNTNLNQEMSYNAVNNTQKGLFKKN